MKVFICFDWGDFFQADWDWIYESIWFDFTASGKASFVWLQLWRSLFALIGTIFSRLIEIGFMSLFDLFFCFFFLSSRSESATRSCIQMARFVSIPTNRTLSFASDPTPAPGSVVTALLKQFWIWIPSESLASSHLIIGWVVCLRWFGSFFCICLLIVIVFCRAFCVFFNWLSFSLRLT